MRTYKIDSEISLVMDYSHRWIITIEKENKLDKLRPEILYRSKLPTSHTDWSQVFTIRNFLKYRWWKLKQYLFWHNVHKPIGNWLKKHTKLNDTHYIGTYIKGEYNI